MSPLSTALSRFSRLCRQVCVCILALAFLLPCAAAARDTKNIYAGYRTLSSSLPDQRLMIHMGVWYPTGRKPGTVKVGDLSFSAARNTPILEGPWPVLVFSHDVTGNAWAHHDLAATLAASGFIVAVPTHDHDNADDMSLFFSDRELPLRTLQIRAALDVVLEHPQIGKQADTERIGFVGFGTPAPAGLLLAGATLVPDAWPLFCTGSAAARQNLSDSLSSEASSREQSSDSSPSLPGEVSPGQTGLPPADNKSLNTNLSTRAGVPDTSAHRASPWCSPFIAGHMDALVSNMERRAAERTEKTAMMRKATQERIRLFKRLSDAVTRTHQRQLRQSRGSAIPVPPVVLPLLPPLSHDRPVQDSRFRALVFVSPGFSMLFDKESLAPVQIPTLFIGAGKDLWNRPSEQAKRFVDMLGSRAQYQLMPEADGPSFQAECQEADPLFPLGDICGTVTKETRESIHTRLTEILKDFFHSSLNMDTSKN